MQPLQQSALVQQPLHSGPTWGQGSLHTATASEWGSGAGLTGPAAPAAAAAAASGGAGLPSPAARALTQGSWGSWDGGQLMPRLPLRRRGTSVAPLSGPSATPSTTAGAAASALTGPAEGAAEFERRRQEVAGLLHRDDPFGPHGGVPLVGGAGGLVPLRALGHAPPAPSRGTQQHQQRQPHVTPHVWRSAGEPAAGAAAVAGQGNAQQQPSHTERGGSASPQATGEVAVLSSQLDLPTGSDSRAAAATAVTAAAVAHAHAEPGGASMQVSVEAGSGHGPAAGSVAGSAAAAAGTVSAQATAAVAGPQASVLASACQSGQPAARAASAAGPAAPHEPPASVAVQGSPAAAAAGPASVNKHRDARLWEGLRTDVLSAIQRYQDARRAALEQAGDLVAMGLDPAELCQEAVSAVVLMPAWVRACKGLGLAPPTCAVSAGLQSCPRHLSKL